MLAAKGIGRAVGSSSRSLTPSRSFTAPPRAPSPPPRAQPPMAQPQQQFQKGNTSTRANRRAAAKPLPSQNAVKRAANKRAAINRAAAGIKDEKAAAAAKQKAALDFEAKNPKTTSPASAAPAYASSAPGYGSPAGYAPSAPGYGSPAGAMGTSSYPSGAMSTSPGIEPLLGRIAIALEQIVQRGGKRLFTLRKRKTRGRGKTRGRR